MNDSLVLLDASLRDGGYRTNFHFNDIDLEEILIPLDNSGIEYIEIGYRNGLSSPSINLGRAGSCSKDYLLFCRNLLKNAKLAVMALPLNICQEDIRELIDCGVDLVRICLSKIQIESSLPKIEMANKANIDVAINLMQISSYDETELDNTIKQVSQYEPLVIYFADSNGSLSPNRTKEIYDRYINSYTVPFGFHAHDNLGLAQANALAAMNAGVRFFDSTLAGMGKGIGNLKTEFFIAYLHSIQLKKYNLEYALKAANYVRHSLKIGQELIEMNEFLRGISNQSSY